MTQVLDRQDAVLGFVSRWVRGLAEVAEQVRVVALEVGDTSGLPDNVDWVELGRRGAVGRYLRYRRALGDAFGRGPSGGFDGLLTHMVPRYSTVAAGWAARAGVAHYLWYTHKGVDRRLLRAIERVDGVFTASEESLRVETPKRIVTGHGIDAEHFDVAPAPLPASVPSSGPAPGSAEAGGAALLSVGRLTAAKDPVCILDAVARLRSEGRDVTLSWAGGGLVARDDEYAGRVMETVRELGLGDAVRFVGAVPYPRVPELYAAATLFVSASRTGSVDKVLLEAMAAGLPCIVSDWDGYRDTVVQPNETEEATGLRIPTRLQQGLGNSEAIACVNELMGDRPAIGLLSQGIAVDPFVLKHSINQLLNSPVRRQEMGDAGQRRVARLYDWKVVIEQWRDLIQDLNQRRESARQTGRTLRPQLPPERPNISTAFGCYATEVLPRDWDPPAPDPELEAEYFQNPFQEWDANLLSSEGPRRRGWWLKQGLVQP